MQTLRTPARVDLRVDDHPLPVAELVRLLGRHELLVGEPDVDAAVPLWGGTAREVGGLLHALGYDGGPVDELLAAWARGENLEHRVLPGAVDVALLDELRARAAGPGGVRPRRDGRRRSVRGRPVDARSTPLAPRARRSGRRPAALGSPPCPRPTTTPVSRSPPSAPP